MLSHSVFFSLLFFFSIATITPSTDNGEFRAFSAVAVPNWTDAAGVCLTGVKVTASALDGHLTNAQLDAARFAFSTPALGSGANLAFYMGVLSAQGTFTQPNSGTVITSASGALAEVVASIGNILVYDDRDGTPGFQVALSNLGKILSCSDTSTDCVDLSASIDLQKNLTWSPISHSNTPCPSGQGYNVNCTVYTLGTTGYYLGSTTITFTFVAANQRIVYNGQDVSPDNAKIDIVITYPWTSIITIFSSPKIALLSAVGGQLVTGSAIQTSTATGNTGSFSWAGTGTQVTTFSWVGSAMVGSSSSSVITAYLTDDDILSYSCTLTSCNFYAAIFLLYLQAAAKVWQVFHWKTALVFFSWADVKPASVSWDPAVGSANSGSLANSSLLLVLLLIMLLFRNHWK